MMVKYIDIYGKNKFNKYPINRGDSSFKEEFQFRIYILINKQLIFDFEIYSSLSYFFLLV